MKSMKFFFQLKSNHNALSGFVKLKSINMDNNVSNTTPQSNVPQTPPAPPSIPARPKSNVEVIAEICHEANRMWCEANGDYSQKPWKEAEQWQKDSAIAGVSFRLGRHGSAPSAQHNNWMQQKLNDGWKYGPVKDAEKKTHPCIVPFDELPLVQRKKDSMFGAIVDALA